MSDLMGKINPAEHDDFVEMDEPYASGSGMYLRSEADSAFRQMRDDAQRDGVDLQVISASRSWARQKWIWERKWRGARKVEGKNLKETIPAPVDRALKILEYSSMPGSSRHHWGTDIDINSLENSYFATGKGKKEYIWLTTHASEYGFCQVYSAKGPDRPYGYNEEKWHWSYLPLAREMTAQFKDTISYDHFTDFAGHETAEKIGIIDKYVLGLNPACQ